MLLEKYKCPENHIKQKISSLKVFEFRQLELDRFLRVESLIHVDLYLLEPEHHVHKEDKADEAVDCSDKLKNLFRPLESCKGVKKVQNYCHEFVKTEQVNYTSIALVYVSAMPAHRAIHQRKVNDYLDYLRNRIPNVPRRLEVQVRHALVITPLAISH